MSHQSMSNSEPNVHKEQRAVEQTFFFIKSICHYQKQKKSSQPLSHPNSFASHDTNALMHFGYFPQAPQALANKLQQRAYRT